jgi:indolepyruvate ferredoxin oxidoreductase
MAVAPVARREVKLDDRYVLDEGTVFMTGVQALVRLPIEQMKRDRAAGLHTGTLISGYPGSPLGGYDLELHRARRFLEPLDIKLVPGLNEELAAANVWGSQMTEVFGRSRFDGVTGIWYGKSPGVDRCLDMFRHANLGGGPQHSGLLALAADDPQAKSSTIPNQSEWDFVACAMPVLAPAGVGELVSLGLHGIALSRLTGLWPAMKCVTNVCDGAASINVSKDLQIVIPDLGDFQKPSSFIFFAPGSIELERHLFEERFPAAFAYARANRLNEVVQRGRRDRLGVVAAGKTYTDLVQAFTEMGLGEAQLAELGVRVLKLSMIYPLEPQVVREFARGLDEIVVVEEKRDLVESQLRSILYGEADRPAVVGKRDEHGHALFPIFGELDSDLVTERLGPRLLRLGGAPESVSRRLKEIEEVRGREYTAFARRMPNYCPGCPHSRSTVRTDGELVGGGIGCHGMAPMMTQDERTTMFAAPMGAEGSPWIGASPWVESDHFVQNVGDGTFFHSASQSVRACVAAGVNITYKLLYNRHVAMTGGQHAEGGQEVVPLTHYLKSEGVKRTIVVSEYFDTYAGVELADNAKLYDRTRYEEAVRELREVPGVTVLLFDQECAAEKRRARKRGKLPEPEKYVFINEEVCEGCGDCGDVSNCMSVQPVETELGRKTQIHQASCNKDYSCTRGDCPSFLTVYTSKGLVKKTTPAIEASAIAEPKKRVGARHGYRVYMPGIGGTGVVTANQVLAYAAMMEGKQVHVLDQTGLAQKGGAVLSSLTVYEGAARPHMSNKVGLGRADLMIGLDTLGVVNAPNADRMSPQRTVVVADSTLQPTAEVVRHVNFMLPGKPALQRAIDAHSRAEENVWVEAGKVSETLFGDQALTNIFMVGVAYQAGLLPMASKSIEAAVKLNGVAVEKNLQAFRYGRLFKADPAQVTRLLGEPVLSADEVRERQLATLGADGRVYSDLLERCAALGEESRRLLALRVAELIRYQDSAYARRYVDAVLAVWEKERAAVPGQEALTQAAARYLYKLMAYKDEYEVARLLLKGEWAERVRSTFNDPQVKFNLHPPLLRERGLKSKLELGGWFKPLLGLLIPMRRVRGTAWDLFGRAEVRRVERELVGWYAGLLEELSAGLDASNHKLAVTIASAPDRIRGYEQIKLGNVKVTREFVDRKLEEFRAGRTEAPTPVTA